MLLTDVVMPESISGRSSLTLSLWITGPESYLHQRYSSELFGSEFESEKNHLSRQALFTRSARANGSVPSAISRSASADTGSITSSLKQFKGPLEELSLLSSNARH